MIQLMPVTIDKIGAASVMSGDQRYETADHMQGLSVVTKASTLPPAFPRSTPGLSSDRLV